MTSNNKGARRIRQKEKAIIFYSIYQSMGVDRSLKKLGDHVRAMGVRITDKTLERFSVKFSWQVKLLDSAAYEQKRIERDNRVQTEAMDTRQAATFRALMDLAESGIRNHAKVLKKRIDGGDEDAEIDIDILEIAKILKMAQYGERLAMGAATSRSEISEQVTNTVVVAFAKIFKTVTVIIDPLAREDEWIRLCDDYLRDVRGQFRSERLTEGHGYIIQ